MANDFPQSSGGGERMVLVMPADVLSPPGRDALDYRELWNILWRDKWVIVGVTTLFAVLSIAYALLATQWYRADVVLIPAKSREGLASQLGNLAGLASLAGVNIGDRNESAEAVAVLKSRAFTRAFIESQNLLPVLYADDWDAKANRWKPADPEKWPDIRDAIKLFENTIRRISEDKKTGLVTLSIEWKDRELAAKWANLLVTRANDRMRERALAEAEVNVNFLRGELTSTNLVTLQQSIGRLLERELQNLMLARGNQEFAFRVIDQATAPKWRSRPKRVLLVTLATMAGGIISVLLVFAQHAMRRNLSLGSETGSIGAAPARQA